MARAKRSGRRSGKPDTRAEILAAARTLFAAEGYEPVSMRVAMNGAPAPAANNAEAVDQAHAALDGGGDVELTITGSEVRWVKKEAPAAAPR